MRHGSCLPLVAALLMACSSSPAPTPSLVPPAATPSAAPVEDVCHVAGQVLCALDPRVDPGADLAHLKLTICSGHWSSQVRPPVNITNAWKARDFIDLARPVDPSTGMPITSFSQTEGDHRLPIGLAGDPGAYQLADGRWQETSAVRVVGPDRLPLNFSLEYPASPNPKDSAENTLHSQVCAGTVTLAAAQLLLVTRWLGPFPSYSQ